MRLSRGAVTAAGLASAVVLSLMYVSWPAGHIPLYDANLVRLAESELQGYCAGETFWRSGGTGDAAAAGECRSRLAGEHSDELDVMRVQPAFCKAIVDMGWEGTAAQCLEIMDQNQYWPTYDGAISADWNRARPYPRPVIATSSERPSDGSRTGGHSGESRPDGDPRDGLR